MAQSTREKILLLIIIILSNLLFLLFRGKNTAIKANNENEWEIQQEKAKAKTLDSRPSKSRKLWSGSALNEHIVVVGFVESQYPSVCTILACSWNEYIYNGNMAFCKISISFFLDNKLSNSFSQYCIHPYIRTIHLKWRYLF